MHAQFQFTSHGWQCRKVWHDLHASTAYYKYVKILFINVKRAPKLGFCKRPHKYL